MSVKSVKNGTRTISFLAGNAAFIPNSFESIATVNGNGSSTSLTFSSIPSTYKHLQIRFIAKRVYTTGVGSTEAQVTFNGDTSASYTTHNLAGDGTSASAGSYTGLTKMYVQQSVQSSASGDANIFGVGIIDILDYASTTKNKTMRSISGSDRNASTPAPGYIYMNSGLWINTAAITSITLACSTAFTSEATFALYGIKG